MAERHHRGVLVRRALDLLELLAGSPRPLTVAELHEAVRLAGHRRGVRTVYRDVELLEQAGLVERLPREGSTEPVRATHRLVRIGRASSTGR